MFPDISCDDIFRLETAHLWLRWLRAGDAAAVKAFASLAGVAQMTASIPHPYPAGEAERFILRARAATSAGRALILAVTLKTRAQTVVGLVSAQASDAREVEIGYVIAPGSAKRGYATEATSALIDAVFNLTEVREIKANCRVINPASRRVLEKCGFAAVGSGLQDLPARGGHHPCEFFNLTRHRRMSQEKAKRPLRELAHQAVREEGPQRTSEQAQQQQ